MLSGFELYPRWVPLLIAEGQSNLRSLCVQKIALFLVNC